MKSTLILTGDKARNAICALVRQAPEGYAVTISEPTRNLEQNSALWPRLQDISRQLDWHGVRLSPDEWKDLLSAGLIKSKVVPNLEGNGFVILGQRTSQMSKRLFAELLELVTAFGTQRGVRWSEPGLYRDDARDAYEITQQADCTW